MAEFCAAHEAMLAAERVLAAEFGEPYAVPLEFPVQWDIGAPLPHLIKTGYQTFPLFLLGDTQLQRDGFYAAVANPGEEHLATVEFKGCVSAKMGAPNDEVLLGVRPGQRGGRGCPPKAAADTTPTCRWR
jgi:hypothetical protein